MSRKPLNGTEEKGAMAKAWEGFTGLFSRANSAARHVGSGYQEIDGDVGPNQPQGGGGSYKDRAQSNASGYSSYHNGGGYSGGPGQ